MLNLIKIIIFILSFTYFFYNIYIGYDYVKDIYKTSGILAIIGFFLSFIMKFCHFKFHFLIKFFGKLSLFYAYIHFLNFLIIDNRFDISQLKINLLVISNTMGLLTLIIMTLALSKRHLSLLPSALILSTFHYALSVKIPEINHYAAIVLAFLILIKVKNDIRKD